MSRPHWIEIPGLIILSPFLLAAWLVISVLLAWRRSLRWCDELEQGLDT